MIKKIVLSLLMLVPFLGAEQDDYVVQIAKYDSLAFVALRTEFAVCEKRPDLIGLPSQAPGTPPYNGFTILRSEDAQLFKSPASGVRCVGKDVAVYTKTYVDYDQQGSGVSGRSPIGDLRRTLSLYSENSSFGQCIFINVKETKENSFNPSYLGMCSLEGNFIRNSDPKSGSFKITAMRNNQSDPEGRIVLAILWIFSNNRDKVDPVFASKVEKSFVPIVSSGCKNPMKKVLDKYMAKKQAVGTKG